MGNKPLKMTARFLLLACVLVLFSGCAVYQRTPHAEDPLSSEDSELLQKAWHHVWQRHYERALMVLDEIEDRQGVSTDTNLMRGQIYYTLESWDAAEKAFKDVLVQSPGTPEAVVHLWFLDAVLRGFNEQAIDELKQKALRYLAENPEEPKSVYSAVLALEGARAIIEKSDVIETYGHLIDNPHWRKDLGEIYFYDTLRTDTASRLKRARFFRKEFPKHRFRYNMADVALSVLKETGPKAVQSEAHEILKVEPKNRVLNYLAAKAVMEAGGDFDLAAKYIRQAIRAAGKPDPVDRFAFVDDKTWQRLMDRSRADYHAIHGRIHFLKGNMRQAFRQFKKGLAYDAQGSRLHLWYAEALEQSGNSNDAMHHFRAALELSDCADAVNGMRRLLRLQDIHADPADYFARLEGVSRFTDVTAQAGINGSNGSRASWSDMDLDGFPDLVIGGNTIFRNNGDGTFDDVTKPSGMLHVDASGSILADFDKDVFPDLVVFTPKEGPKMYLNRTGQAGSIKVSDVTTTRLPVWPFKDAPTEAAAAADVDGDGSVDIYFANFEKRHPTRCMCASDVFYLNQGNGIFTDATTKITYASEESMCGRGASFADFNGDRRPDLFVANYRLDPDFFLVNNSGSKRQGPLLVDQAHEFNVRGRNVQGSYGHSIGGAWGYLETDRPALFVASLAHPRLLGLSDTSTLYTPSSRTEGFEGHFEDLGFSYHETHSDPSFIDVDQDGDLDLFITSVYRGSPSFLYLNHAGRFVDVSWLFGLRVYDGWGTAWADYDRDGDLDLLVCAGGNPRLLRNESQASQRKWLAVRAIGRQSPVTGIGTKVLVQTLDGTESWVREIRAGRGTGNQDEAIAHFGLGENKGPFKVVVQFPSGADVVLEEVPCCQRIEVAEPYF